MKILIVEDQPDLRFSLRELLELEGHEVLAGADGVEGVELARQLPELILCDVDMPRMDGHGMLAAVREMPALAQVPFIFLTGRDKRDDLRGGMALGADDYITKPFRPQEILDAIAARTRRQKPWREQVEKLANARRQEATAAWSHELLTPLNAILGSLDLLETEAESLSPQELKEILGFLRQGALRQERLSRKLIFHFHLERLLGGGEAPRRGPSQVPTAVASGVARAVAEKGQAERIAATMSPGAVAIDEELLVFAVGEVVANALGFSPARSPVTIRGEVAGGRYQLTIDDAGPGMAPEERAGIAAFRQFGRDKREQQGLGLGLAIAANTARAAGGELRLEPSPAGGLRVRFDLPLAQG